MPPAVGRSKPKEQALFAVKLTQSLCDQLALTISRGGKKMKDRERRTKTEREEWRWRKIVRQTEERKKEEERCTMKLTERKKERKKRWGKTKH